MKRCLLVLACLAWASLAGASPAAYDYPLDDAMAATVVGTPSPYQAPLPEEIPVETMTLKVFEQRAIPEVFWYNAALDYALVAQKHEAPLIFIISGTGASYHSPKVRILQKAFYQAGFHSIALPSPTYSNFIVTASSTMIPGYIEEDARDLYRLMNLVRQQVADRIQISAFHLTGYSLGAAQAAFVAKLDEQQGLFNFKKVLMINPPVSLYNSVKILDDLLNENLPGGPAGFTPFFNAIMREFAEIYDPNADVEFNDDFLYAVYRQERPPEYALAALIGIAFRISSTNMVFTADVMTNDGFIAPKNARLTSYSSLTDFGVVGFRTSFVQYFDDMFLPYFQRREPGLTREALIARLSLRTIEAYLRRSPKIGLMHNQDDIIMAPGELDYLAAVFGPRAKIFPKGGHCGNMGHKDNVAHMLGFFSQ